MHPFVKSCPRHLAGPDAGMLEATIDGAPTKRFDLLHGFSSGLHYPRSIIFETDLPPGSHVLTLKLYDQKNAASIGTAARILKFCVNQGSQTSHHTGKRRARR